jgi:LuxR family transcriptional regulator of csgAB operon
MKDFETGHDIDRPGMMLEKRSERAPGEGGRLTSEEIEILAMVALGATDKQIADRLRLSQETVKARVKGIFKKINAPNRFQASLWAAMNL